MLRQRVIELVQLLREREKLPAMVVAFSCDRLTWLAQQLQSVDLLPSKGRKSKVHVQFRRIQKCVAEEEWELFAPLMELAKRGIGVHHSKNPKHYLELLPELVQQGLVTLVFTTSTLSAGIDLPVRTAVLLELTMPTGGRDFQPIEPNLFHQICGRAGRPGLETEGNVVIARWKKTPGVDVPALIQSEAQPVRSQYKLTANTVLNILIRSDTDDAVEQLLRASFGTPDYSSVPGQIRRHLVASDTVAAAHPAAVPVAEAAAALRKARRIAARLHQNPRYVALLKQRIRPGVVVDVDPAAGRYVPDAFTAESRVQRRSFTVRETTECLDVSWVFRVRGAGIQGCDMRVVDDVRALDAAVDACLSRRADDVSQETLAAARQICDHRDEVRRLRQDLSPENLPMWAEYQRLIGSMRRFQFVDADNLPTRKGRMAATLLAPDDPLAVVECWYNGRIPKDPERFLATLSCFLCQRRHNQPTKGLLIHQFRELQETQETIHPSQPSTLGTLMIAPCVLWMRGRYVSDIVRETEISAGHFCKEILRLVELVRQLSAAADVVGDPELANICARVTKNMTRGLPFLESMKLM